MTSVDRPARSAAAGVVTAGDLRTWLALTGVIAAIALTLAYGFGELIPFHGGFGYDGNLYGTLVMHPGEVMDLARFDVHRAQRVVPSFIAWLALSPVGLNDHRSAVIGWFHFYDFALVLGTVTLFWRTARLLRLGRPAAWVGFVALVGNYAVMKWPGFYPVLTDISGLFLGMLVLYLWVARREWWLPAVALVGAFTWPTVTYSALVLFVLARGRDLPLPDPRSRPQRVTALLVATGVATGVAAFAASLIDCLGSCTADILPASLWRAALPVSVPLFALALGYALYPIGTRLSVPAVIRSILWYRIPIAAVIVWGTARVAQALGTPSEFTLGRTLSNTALGGVVKPFGNLVAHSVFYGMAVPLLILTWPLAVRAAGRLGVGFLAMLAMFVLLGSGAESRILFNQWPVFALLAALVADRLGWGWRSVAIFGTAAVVSSRFWFPLANHGPFSWDSMSYPTQWYAMSVGLRMTIRSYLLMGSLTLLMVAVVAALLVANRRSSAAPLAAAPASDGGARPEA